MREGGKNNEAPSAHVDAIPLLLLLKNKTCNDRATYRKTYKEVLSAEVAKDTENIAIRVTMQQLMDLTENKERALQKQKCALSQGRGCNNFANYELLLFLPFGSREPRRLGYAARTGSWILLASSESGSTRASCSSVRKPGWTRYSGIGSWVSVRV